MEKGLITGKHLFTGSTHLKANANKNKYRNEGRDIRYIDMLNEDIKQERASRGKKLFKTKSEAPKTKPTKVSTTAPDSGFMTRDNKPKGFFYPDHAVGGKHSIIFDTFATPGNVNDSWFYIKRLDYLMKKFCFKPQAVGLDTDYFTAPVTECLQRRGIKDVFGYCRPIHTKNDSQIQP